MGFFLDCLQILLQQINFNELKINYILIFVALTTLCNAQGSKIWSGKVVSEITELQDIFILNKKNNLSTTTKYGGYFEIKAAVGDTLQFSSVQFKGVTIVLKRQDVETDLVFVKMEALVTQLEAVQINQYNYLNAVSLGILQKPAKQYTVAERRMNSASGSPIEGLFNLLSGEKKVFKQNLEIERKEMAVEKIGFAFYEKYFVETLKIPQENIKGFQYYCAEDSEFCKVLKDKNKTMTKFLLVDLARNYLILQKQN